MESVIASDRIIQIALYTGGFIFILVFILMIQVIIMRISYQAKRRKRYKLLNKWRPFLTHTLITGDTNVQPLSPGDRGFFLEEWNRLFGTVRGDHLEVLVRLAHRLRVGYFARRSLNRKNMRVRLFAILTLGHMREYAAWDELVDLLKHPHSILSLTAARSLMWIDAKNAIGLIMPYILNRNDWPWSNIAHILKQASPDDVCEILSEAAKLAPRIGKLV